jgi:hypothetical protein
MHSMDARPILKRQIPVFVAVESRMTTATEMVPKIV